MHKLWWMRGPLRDANKQDGSDSSGGGGDNQPKPFTADDAAKLVDEKLNGFAKRFKTEVSGEFTSIKSTLAEFAESFKTIKPPEPQPTGGGDGKTGNTGDPKLTAELENERKERKKLEKAVQDLQEAKTKADKEAAEAALKSAVSKSLSGFTFFDEDSQELAFTHIASKARRDEDGNFIVAGETGDVPLQHYAKSYMEKKPNLLKPVDTRGSGARGGNSQSSEGFDMDKIKPGMSAEDVLKAVKAIRDNLPRR